MRHLIHSGWWVPRTGFEKHSMSVVTLHKSACLFHSRFISYPRTETNMFPQNMNLTLLVEQQTQDNEWGNFAQRILESGGPTPRNGNKSDQAHPPIHPTKYTNSLQVSNPHVQVFPLHLKTRFIHFSNSFIFTYSTI